MRRRSVQRAILPFALALFVLVAAASVDAQGGAGDLKVVVGADLISPDPARVGKDAISEAVHHLLYTTLIAYDAATGEYLPRLAASFRPRDPLTWEFELAGGGLADPVAAAADVARHFRRIVTPAGIDGFPSPARERLPYVSDVQASGSRLTFHLSEPWPGLPAALAREPVARYRADGTLVGTGRFLLERWDRGNRFILRRVGEAAPGEFERVWFEVIPSAEERWRLLAAGSAHVAFDLPQDALARILRSPGVDAVLLPQARVHFVELNVTRPPFNDVRVRRALNLAVDTNALIAAILPGRAFEAATLFSPAVVGYEPSVVPFGYDPVRARELLAQAGYRDGFEFELDVPRTQRRLGEVLSGLLAEVGVEVVVRVWNDWAEHRREVEMGRRYAWLADWSPTGPDPGVALWERLHSRGAANAGGYRNETLDSLLTQAEGTLDPRDRLEQYRALQRLLRQDAPFLMGYVAYDVYGIAAGLHWAPRPGAPLNLGEVRRR